MAAAVLVALGFASVRAAPNRGVREAFQAVEQKITGFKKVAVGKTIDVVLGEDEAFRMLFDSKYGIREVVLHHQRSPRELMAYTVFPHGTVNQRGAASGSFRVIGSDVGEHIIWNLRGDKMHIVYQIEDNPSKLKVLWKAAFSAIAAREPASTAKTEWDYGGEFPKATLLMDSAETPYMMKLRTKYHLDELVQGATCDLEKLKIVCHWVHGRWRHAGDSRPSRSDPLTILMEAERGKRFRCVEYAILMAACARALGMPARVLGLQTADVETVTAGAGHVVAEVWVEPPGKWVFADAQWDVVPRLKDNPLNAVELLQALKQSRANDLVLTTCPVSDGGQSTSLGEELLQQVMPDQYGRWIHPYLHYFTLSLDQRFASAADSQPISGRTIMLIPKGAKKPVTFQGKSYDTSSYIYVVNPSALYAVSFARPSPASHSRAPGDDTDLPSSAE
jgi:hypothetical protein